jgi:hypothetical protein
MQPMMRVLDDNQKLYTAEGLKGKNSMKRLIAALVAAIVATPALTGSTLANIPITTAVAAQTTTAVVTLNGPPQNLVIQCNFTYGSGGTSADVWIQTSLDNTTWIDVAECGFTTASVRKL